MVTADAARAREPRLDSLTGLRWWAAFGVFAYHMKNLAPLPVLEVLELGNYGVMFFFVLSGFVLTWSARPSTTTGTFYWRRFARIYPAHLVALVLAVPVFYSLTPAASDWWVKPLDVGVLMLSVLLIQGWWREPAILFSGNPAAWTLTVEAFFYALHPWLSRVLRLVRSRGALAIAAGLIAGAFLWRALEIFVPGVATAPVPVPVTRLAEFALGMCLAHAMRHGWVTRMRPGLAYLAATALVVVLTVDLLTEWLGPVRDAVRHAATESILIVCAALIVTVAARDIRGRRSLLRQRWLVFLGEVSYAFYLVHATVIYVVLSLVGPQLPGWGAIVWYPPLFSLALVLAIALHLGVEKPLERRLRSWGEARLVRRATAPDGPTTTAESPATAFADGR